MQATLKFATWRHHTLARQQQLHCHYKPQPFAQPKQQRKLLCKAVEGATLSVAQPITLSDAALEHLNTLKAKRGNTALLFRVGVKQGGCSGLSYAMDFEEPEKVTSEDTVVEYEGGFKLVVDPKSLLYLFGMKLDYSDALIGGGFKFQNPNAADSCGCGKSFGV